ncbi:dihydrolipoamide acetyltransferase family protein [Mucilaginibacter sp. UR6-11]|uniref:dihydrolipoamide acetyltransferase family protein n=1 Tax=Mucilaginibacter sp. UR6-11 TaxID=1435644 RepID=UPI001E2B3266|nr:dihydrolipoamide acetyltransferase family protein [Mucilaginibacter sp. UR6-11]MCC8426980.1 2-oxo acid dehydrogenase subunit E2 [Mucilaginibacter sp. UR6-11]
MAKYQLLLPKMGESVAEATVIKWLKKPGDYIEADDAVMEIATDKVDSEVPSPVAGRLVEQRCKEDEVVQVGSVIAVIETDEPEQAASAPQPVIASQPTPVASPAPQASAAPASPQPQSIPGTEQLAQRTQAPAPQSSNGEFKSGSRFYSPLVKHIAQQENISIAELEHIPGSGAEGRLTKDDLLGYIRNKGNAPAAAQQAAAPQTAPAQQQSAQAKPTPPEAPKAGTPRSEPVKPAFSATGVDEIIEMDRMRRLIADHMVMSKHTSPHVTSFVEADVTGLVLWREKIKNSFEKREGEKITFTPIFIEAVVKAIKDYPMVNVSVNGTQIIKKAAINISMATALPNGNLIVPVIKKAEELNLLGITKAVNSLANKARTGKLQPDDVKDGTFTITNVGTFGNVMGTPIINQPQVAILAVGAIKKKPAVIETPQGDVIAIRHMMFLSLSYDHRVVDGALGGTFLSRIAYYLENWDADKEV